jgi:hypothetical protein
VRVPFRRRPPAPAHREPPPAGLTPLELANYVMSRIDHSSGYVRDRKQRFRANSSWLKLTGLALSATSTIILGLQDLDFWTGLAFALVAVLTVLGAVEPFFAWRSRWILMEEAAYRFHRLRDDITFYLAATPADDLDPAVLSAYFGSYQDIWVHLSERWLEHRHPPAHGG